MRIEVRDPRLAQPAVAIYERARYERSGLAPGQAVAVAANRQVLFRGEQAVRVELPDSWRARLPYPAIG